MTWSQIDYFSRAARLAELEGYRVALAIAHNPYADTEQKAARLGQAFDREARSLQFGQVAPAGGLRMGDLYKAFGPAGREQVSREKWEEMRRARLEARERTRQLVEQRLGAGG
jgi:hypothetical protein